MKIALLEYLEDISRRALGHLFLEDSLVKIRIELSALGFNDRHIMVIEKLEDHLVDQPDSLEQASGPALPWIGAIDSSLKIIYRGEQAAYKVANRRGAVSRRLASLDLLEVLKFGPGPQQLL